MGIVRTSLASRSAVMLVVLVILAAASPLLATDVLAQGNCIYPDDLDAAGNRCGARSALSRPGGYEPVPRIWMPQQRQPDEMVLSHPGMDLGPTASEVPQFHGSEDLSLALAMAGGEPLVERGRSYDFPSTFQVGDLACLAGIRESIWRGVNDFQGLVVQASTEGVGDKLLGAVSVTRFRVGSREVLLVGYQRELVGYRDGIAGIVNDLWGHGKTADVGFFEGLFSEADETQTIGYYWVEAGKEVLVACIARKDQIGMAMIRWNEMVSSMQVR